MKNKLAVLLLFSVPVLAGQANPFKADWQALMARAAAEKKLIFIDAYTDWCGWCEEMDKKTFPDRRVADFIAAHFVSAKLEMEKDDLGRKLARKYLVTGFPSFLVFDANGRMVYWSMGYQPPEPFLKTLQAMIDPTQQLNLKGYDASRLDMEYPPFYNEALGENGKRKFPTDEEVNAYMKGAADLFSEVNANILFRFCYQLQDSYVEHLFRNRDRYADLFGKAHIDDALWGFVYRRVGEAAKEKNRQGLDDILKKYDSFLSSDPIQRIALKISYFIDTKEWPLFAAAVREALQSGAAIDSSYINNLAWTLYENSDDAALNGLAAAWMKPVVEKEPQYMYLDTYAAVLFKAGRLGEAEQFALTAIDAGRKAGEKVEGTEKLLAKIREKLKGAVIQILFNRA